MLTLLLIVCFGDIGRLANHLDRIRRNGLRSKLLPGPGIYVTADSKQVSKYYNEPKSQLGWLNMAHSSTLTPLVTAKTKKTNILVITCPHILLTELTILLSKQLSLPRAHLLEL